MRSVIQRVRSASVTVEDRVVAKIGVGLVALIGVADGDGPADIDYTASKIRELRIFPDADGKMNRSIADAGGEVLAVSQFTLMGDVRKGRRPAFDAAARPEDARARYDAVVDAIKAGGISVVTGVFQAHMHVALVNDGPVTILIDSRREF